MREFSPMAITFNGNVLDEEIKGYTTINVEGRSLMAPELSTFTVPGRDGDVVSTKQYPAKDIVVHFLLEEENHVYFMESLRRLNVLLQSKGAVPFSFYDEWGYRTGQVSAVNDPPYDQLAGVGSFTIHCSDPFMYGHMQSATDRMPPLKSAFPVKIESIVVSVDPNTTSLVVRNVTTGKKIILTDLPKKAGELVITMDDITFDGENCMSALDFAHSDYHGFELHGDDVLEYEPTSVAAVVTFRERVL